MAYFPGVGGMGGGAKGSWPPFLGRHEKIIALDFLSDITNFLFGFILYVGKWLFVWLYVGKWAWYLSPPPSAPPHDKCLDLPLLPLNSAGVTIHLSPFPLYL